MEQNNENFSRRSFLVCLLFVFKVNCLLQIKFLKLEEMGDNFYNLSKYKPTFFKLSIAIKLQNYGN